MKKYLVTILVAVMFLSAVLPVQNAFAIQQSLEQNEEPQSNVAVESIEPQANEESQANLAVESIEPQANEDELIQPTAVPLIVGAIIGYAVRYGAQKAIIKYGQKAVDDALKHSYKSFDALKRNIGTAGTNKHWHHIVEQSQITRSGFNPFDIHFARNVIDLDASTHSKITGFYNSLQQGYAPYKTVRHWMDAQPYDVQYKEGLKIMKSFGVDAVGLF